jgi:predicted alpha/beta hydrolase
MLPTPLRPGLRPLASAWRDRFAAALPGWVWRGLHPFATEAFAAAPPPASRWEGEAGDGSPVAVEVVPAVPGAPGEPVLVLHTLGLGPRAYRVGAGLCAGVGAGAGEAGQPWVAALRAAGFTPVLAAWRGDPEVGGAAADLDAVARLDVPALLALVQAHTGARRVPVVGHGLGGLAALAHVALVGDDAVAGLALLGVPVRFDGVSAGVRAALRAARLLPAAARLPARSVAPWVAASVPAGAARQRLRGALTHGVGDVPVAVLHQAAAWLEQGALVDRAGARDYALGLDTARAPLAVVTAEGDGLAPPAAAVAVRGLWGGPSAEIATLPADWGHLDLVLHDDAVVRVGAPLAAWLDGVRDRVWGADGAVTVHAGLRPAS